MMNLANYAFMLASLILCIRFSDGVLLRHHQYAGDQILKLKGDKSTIKSRLIHLEDKHAVDVMGHDGIIHVPHNENEAVKLELSSHGLTYEIIVQDLQKYLQEHDEMDTRVSRVSTRTCTANSCTSPLTDQWMTLEQMEWYLLHINKTYSQRVEVTSIGKSIEGRDIWLVHIKSSRCTSKSKAVWIEGGIHAREWISHAVSLYTIERLIKQCYLSSNLEFYIVPNSNPDGYLYTHTNQRLWRKNRRDNVNSNCFGVDLNRNWDYNFGVGASNSPCSEVYKGTDAFSEPETLALSEAMKNISNLYIVISVHSFGQLLLYPWGWTTTEIAPDTESMIILGNVFKNAVLKENGNFFSVENSAAGLYFASGTTDDWAKATLPIKYSYTLECQDTSDFIVPVNKINGYVQEIWRGFDAMFKDLQVE